MLLPPSTPSSAHPSHLMNLLPFLLLVLSLPFPTSSQPSCPTSPVSIQTRFSWTAAVDPKFPAGPNLTIVIGFTPLVCITHLPNVTLWNPNQPVTPPIAMLMRSSNMTRLDITLRRWRRQRQILDAFVHDNNSLPEDSITFSLDIEPPFTRLSCVARILPSPGWFIGLPAVDLCEKEGDPQSDILFPLPGWNSGIYINQVYRGELLHAMKPPGPVTMLTGFASSYGQITVRPLGESATIPTDSEPTSEPSSDDGNGSPEGDAVGVGEGDNACFAAGESVALETGLSIPVEQLELGSVVMSTGVGSYSQVFVFSHRDQDVFSTFVQLRFRGRQGHGRIRLSPGHYIYRMRSVCGGGEVFCSDNFVMVMARDVREGDFLVGKDGSPAAVTEVSYVRARGLYNPHTLDGDIIVSGVRVSVYTATVEPRVASALLAPVRGLFLLRWSGLSAWLSHSVLPKGWNSLLGKIISFRNFEYVRPVPEWDVGTQNACYSLGSRYFTWNQ